MTFSSLRKLTFCYHSWTEKKRNKELKSVAFHVRRPKGEVKYVGKVFKESFKEILKKKKKKVKSWIVTSQKLQNFIDQERATSNGRNSP